MTRDCSARPSARNFNPPPSCHNVPTSPLLRIMADQTDRVMCYACGGISLKDEAEDRPTCLHCESDFVEIIEIPPDNDPPELRTEPDSRPINPWADHDPWRHEDLNPSGFWDASSSPSGSGGSRSPGSQQYSHRTYRSADGRFTFTSTSMRGATSRQGPNPTVPMMLQGLDAVFQALSETGETRLNNRGSRGAAMDPLYPNSPGWGEHGHTGSEGFPDPDEIAPRDPDAPRFGPAPVGSLADLLESFQPEYGRRRGVPGTRGAPPNPFAMLSALLNMNRDGDAVYSQEELDRVVSQLIDHNAPGTAPPPASSTAIHSLPHKKIDREMLGSDGTAECSICMEAVEIGTEVTVLPCTHWFHFGCIEAWLNQHNTCPHCRRSIDASCGATGEGTRDDPFIVQSSPDPATSDRQRRRSSTFSFGRRSSSRSIPDSPPGATFIPDSNAATERRSRVSSRSSQNSRNEGQRGGITGWVWSRLGGGNN